MTTLQTNAPGLDESTRDFIATFLSKVAIVVGYGEDRVATIARVKTLLLDAVIPGDRATAAAWSGLYRTIRQIIATPAAADARSAHAYLQTFVHENDDLADE